MLKADEQGGGGGDGRALRNLTCKELVWRTEEEPSKSGTLHLRIKRYLDFSERSTLQPS
jgi:hypothetical protein